LTNLNGRKLLNTFGSPIGVWDKRATFIPPDEVLTDKEVEITILDGTKKKVPNPLLAYTFPEGSGLTGTTHRNDNLKG
jgi:hypothetical protein